MPPTVVASETPPSDRSHLIPGVEFARFDCAFANSDVSGWMSFSSSLKLLSGALFAARKLASISGVMFAICIACMGLMPSDPRICAFDPKSKPPVSDRRFVDLPTAPTAFTRFSPIFVKFPRLISSLISEVDMLTPPMPRNADRFARAASPDIGSAREPINAEALTSMPAFVNAACNPDACCAKLSDDFPKIPRDCATDPTLAVICAIADAVMPVYFPSSPRLLMVFSSTLSFCLYLLIRGSNCPTTSSIPIPKSFRLSAVEDTSGPMAANCFTLRP
jgi:hypothetical protein